MDELRAELITMIVEVEAMIDQSSEFLGQMRGHPLAEATIAVQWVLLDRLRRRLAETNTLGAG